MKNLFLKIVLSSVIICLINCTFQPNDSDDPFLATSTDFQRWGPRITDDEIMPNSSMIQRVENWSRESFSMNHSNESEIVLLQLIRQDHSTLKFDQSCMGTSLKIGSRTFVKGLGTHSNSEIRIIFPEPVTKFSSFVGIDNNYSTVETHGSVQFAVICNNKEIIRTPTIRGSDEAVMIDILLPEETTVLTLIVDGTDDGVSYDQADWCEPVAIGASGTIYHLSDEVSFPLNTAIPFSFQYGDVHSSELLPHWIFEIKNIDNLNCIYSWTDPKTNLKVSAHVRRFEHFAGIDWVLYFENTGTKNTLLLENVKVVNMDFNMGSNHTPLMIHTLNGDTNDQYAWLSVEHPLINNQSKVFAPYGGRSSNRAFPFWNIQYKNEANPESSIGVFMALGWTGQWFTEFFRTSDTELEVSAGMEKISILLYPGEKIRSPRVLIMPWKSDLLSSHALFRRLLMFEYAPKTKDGMPQELLVAGQCFDRYYRQLPGWENIEGQTVYSKKLYEVGCNGHWFDAAWFPVGFPNGVGNWFSDTVNFPQGVEALGKVIHDLGMKFILWFEPERVAKGTQIAEKYPQYVFGGSNGGLFMLNDPEARTFLTELILKRIKQFGVDVYRQDFNINPLNFWRENDKTDRQGMTEIRYVEGLYEMWSRLRHEIPDLWIDNCASGGRRIDLETISSSIPLWRSDTNCSPGYPEWNQTQTLGLTKYIPLFGCCSWESDPYQVRSAASMGPIFQYNFMDDNYDLEQARASISESHINQKFWYGDFYPLSDEKTGETEVVAWQLHRADLNAGIVYIFRQGQSPYLGRELQIRAIDPNAKYTVTVKRDYSSGEKKSMTGRELINLEIALPIKSSSVLVQYQLSR